MATPRELSRRVLTRWNPTGPHIETILEDVCRSTPPLSERDRAWVQSTVFGVMRNRRLLDYYVSQLRRGRLDEPTQWLLRIGLQQIFFMRTPAHASVHETAKLAPHKARGLVNAVLRRALREAEALQEMAEQTPPALRYSLPEFLYEKWRRQWDGTFTESLCQWNQQPAPLYLRCNRLRPESLSAVEEHPALKPVTGRPSFYHAGKLPLPLLEKGYAYMQDPATAIACELLDPQPGERVLDACAAPGGKTAYLAQMMENKGSLVATDNTPGRLTVLQDNLARLGVRTATVSLCDWQTCQDNEVMPAFDRILVDTPCSNTGVLRRRVDLRWRLTESVFAERQRLQLSILENVRRVLKPGGCLVYSTCSLEPEENEEVVRMFTERHASEGFRLVGERRSHPVTDGFDGAYAALLQRDWP